MIIVGANTSCTDNVTYSYDSASFTHLYSFAPDGKFDLSDTFQFFVNSANGIDIKGLSNFITVYVDDQSTW